MRFDIYQKLPWSWQTLKKHKLLTILFGEGADRIWLKLVWDTWDHPWTIPDLGFLWQFCSTHDGFKRTCTSNWSELPRKWKMVNFEVFLKNKWLKCPKPIISWYHSIVGITIKRLVHIAGLRINPSSQNLRSKLKSGPNYPVWRYFTIYN